MTILECFTLGPGSGKYRRKSWENRLLEIIGPTSSNFHTAQTLQFSTFIKNNEFVIPNISWVIAHLVKLPCFARVKKTGPAFNLMLIVATMVDLRRSHLPHSRPISVLPPLTFSQHHWQSAEAMAACFKHSSWRKCHASANFWLKSQKMCACWESLTTGMNSFGIFPPQQSTNVSKGRAGGIGRPASGHWRLDIGGEQNFQSDESSQIARRAASLQVMCCGTKHRWLNPRAPFGRELLEQCGCIIGFRWHHLRLRRARQLKHGSHSPKMRQTNMRKLVLFPWRKCILRIGSDSFHFF